MITGHDHDIGCECRAPGAGCLQQPAQDWAPPPAMPTGQTALGISIWDAEPGRCLAWRGPGDYLTRHLVIESAARYVLGGDEGTAGPDRHVTLEDARAAAGHYLAAMTTYRSTSQFYAANPARERSPEADYGVMWRSGGQLWPSWRVSYVKDTGEVYAAEIRSGSGPVRVLGIVQADPDEARAAGSYYATLDRILDGWADVEDHDLAWIEGRLTGPRAVRS